MRNGWQCSALTNFWSAQRVVYRLRSLRRNSAFPQNVFRLLLVVLCFAAVALGQSQSQAPPPPSSQPQSQPKPESLGDVARKARAKKGKPESGKVYTEEDLSKLRSGSVSVVGKESSPTTDSPETTISDVKQEGADAAKSGQNDETYWRGRARELQDQMTEVDKEIATVKEEIKKYGAIAFDPATGLRQNIIYVDDRNARLKHLEKKKEDLLKQMDLLQEEGRKAGALPAWFR